MGTYLNGPAKVLWMTIQLFHFIWNVSAFSERNPFVPKLHLCRFGTDRFSSIFWSWHVQAHSQLLDSPTFVQCAWTRALSLNISGQLRTNFEPTLNQLRAKNPRRPNPAQTGPGDMCIVCLFVALFSSSTSEQVRHTENQNTASFVVLGWEPVRRLSVDRKAMPRDAMPWEEAQWQPHNSGKWLHETKMWLGWGPY